MVYGLLVVCLAVNVVLFRKKVNLGWIMIQNAGWIAVMTDISMIEAFTYFREGLLGEKTLSLISIFILILVVESIMRREGMIEQTVKGLKGLLNQSVIAPSIMPLFIGMLPSPGGARLSCPMVDEMTGKEDHHEYKAFVNYWYRHNWMDGFILYPPIILAANMLERDVLSLFLALLPVMGVWFLIGIFMGLRHFKKGKKSSESYGLALKTFIGGFYPIMVIIGLYLICLKVGVFYPLQMTVAMTAIILIAIRKIPLRKLSVNIKEGFKFKFILIFIGVMVFTAFFRGSGLIEMTVSLMHQIGMPTIVILCVLPLMTGLMGGASVTFISLSFPILMGFGIADHLSLFVVSYTFGVIGVMLSPLHLCCVISADYFKVPLQHLIRRVAIASLLLLPVVGLIYIL